jgi:hypothetical protein
MMTGCASRYVPAIPPGQPVAELKVQADTPVFFVRSDAKGCYSGRDELDRSEGDFSTWIPVADPIVLSYEGAVGNKFCRVSFKFIPQANMKYSLLGARGRQAIKDKNFFDKMFARDEQDVCRVFGVEESPDGEKKVMHLQKVNPRQRSIACIRFE